LTSLDDDAYSSHNIRLRSLTPKRLDGVNHFFVLFVVFGAAVGIGASFTLPTHSRRCGFALQR